MRILVFPNQNSLEKLSSPERKLKFYYLKWKHYRLWEFTPRVKSGVPVSSAAIHCPQECKCLRALTLQQETLRESSRNLISQHCCNATLITFKYKKRPCTSVTVKLAWKYRIKFFNLWKEKKERKKEKEKEGREKEETISLLITLNS